MRALEAEIASYNEYDPDSTPLSSGARLLKEKGIVHEQWQNAGTKIEYFKSRLERGGWNMPGPLNLDQEEEDNVD